MAVQIKRVREMRNIVVPRKSVSGHDRYALGCGNTRDGCRRRRRRRAASHGCRRRAARSAASGHETGQRGRAGDAEKSHSNFTQPHIEHLYLSSGSPGSIRRDPTYCIDNECVPLQGFFGTGAEIFSDRSKYWSDQLREVGTRSGSLRARGRPWSRHRTRDRSRVWTWPPSAPANSDERPRLQQVG